MEDWKIERLENSRNYRISEDRESEEFPEVWKILRPTDWRILATMEL